MNTLQFIDAMTGRLAWPVTVIILGLVFRTSLAHLLARVRKLRWREAEAEIVEATKQAEEDVEKRAQPLAKKVGDPKEIEELVKGAALWGALSALSIDNSEDLPDAMLIEPRSLGRYRWDPRMLIAPGERYREQLLQRLQLTLLGEGQDDHGDDDDPPLAGAPPKS